MKKKFALFWVLSYLISSPTYAAATASDSGQQLLSQSESDLVFGPEWTFTNTELLEANRSAIESLQGHLLDQYYAYVTNKFKDHSSVQTIERVEKQVVITLRSAQKIIVGRDPGVLEVQASPMTLSEWKKNQNFIQDIVFDSMKSVGLAPQEREGAGHVNIGFNYFLRRHGLAEKFITDYLNHPGLGIVLNSLTANQVDARNPLNHILAFHEPKYLPDMEKQFLDSINKLKFAPEMEKKYFESENILSYLLSKYVAIGLRNDDNWDQRKINLTRSSTRLEMRQIRPQSSMQDFILVLQLFQSRIKYLETGTAKIRTDRIFKGDKNMDGWEALGQFADYVEEAGLDFKDYKPLLPKVWRDLPVQNFVRDPSIKVMKKSGQCKRLFK